MGTGLTWDIELLAPRMAADVARWRAKYHRRKGMTKTTRSLTSNARVRLAIAITKQLLKPLALGQEVKTQLTHSIQNVKLSKAPLKTIPSRPSHSSKMRLDRRSLTFTKAIKTVKFSPSVCLLSWRKTTRRNEPSSQEPLQSETGMECRAAARSTLTRLDQSIHQRWETLDTTQTTQMTAFCQRWTVKCKTLQRRGKPSCIRTLSRRSYSQ